MPKQNSSKRIPYIDALKGFAIICVVLGHVGNGNMWTPGISPAFFIIYNLTNVFHMALFIMLSGVVFRSAYLGDERRPPQKGRIAGQILNLTILYILWSVLLGLFKMLFSGYVANPVTWLSIVMIPILPLQLYWYLFILIIYYFVFGILGAAKVNKYLMLGITFCLSIISGLIPAGLVFDVKRLLCYGFFFFLGISMNYFEELFQNGKAGRVFRILLPALVVISIVLCIIFWNLDLFLHDVFFVSFLIAFSFSLGFYFLFKYVKWLGENRFLVYIGKHCLEIYLLHSFVLSALRAVLVRLHISSPLLTILAELIGGIGIPLLISLICRKIHIYDIFFAPYKFIQKLRRS